MYLSNIMFVFLWY